MKKIIFSILLFSACALAVQAQSSGCAKSCTAKSASAAGCHAKVGTAANTVVPAEHQAAAAKLAATQRTIEMRKSENGVSYVRRVNEGGTVSYADVSYDAVNNKFVNVSPSEVSTATPSAAGCGPASGTAAKSGCAAGAAGKAGCCASKAKTTTASNTTNATEGKPVKTSGGSN